MGAVDKGLLYGGGFGQLGIQIVGVGAVAAWTLGTVAVLFSVIKATVGLRVSKEDEIMGLDIGEHGTQAYADFHMKSA